MQKASGARPREGKGTHLARQSAVFTCPRLPATPPPPRPWGKPLSSSPVHQLPRPETKIDRDECLAPPSYFCTASLGLSLPTPMSSCLRGTWEPTPHPRQAPRCPPALPKPAPPPSSAPARLQTSKVILGPRMLPRTPLPHLPLVAPGTPRFPGYPSVPPLPQFPLSPPIPPTTPLPHPAPRALARAFSNRGGPAQNSRPCSASQSERGPCLGPPQGPPPPGSVQRTFLSCPGILQRGPSPHPSFGIL